MLRVISRFSTKGLIDLQIFNNKDMELTEKERLMLIEMKNEILKLTLEIMDITKDEDKKGEIKKKITTIISKISIISSYAKPKNINLQPLLEAVNLLFVHMDALEDSWTVYSPIIEMICNNINYIQFDFTKKDIKIKIPKIDLSIFKL